jgi:hypothetical protein
MRELLLEYLSFLNIFVQEAKNKEIYPIFAESKEKYSFFLLNIFDFLDFLRLTSIFLLPLLLTSKDEILEFSENPAGFADFSTKISENFVKIP